MRHAIAIAAARGSGQDRARVVELDGAWIIALADGAGGTGNGAIAADAIVDAVVSQRDCCELLDELDADGPRLGFGQSTAVIVSLRDGVLSGASVGDSGAWLIDEMRVVDLTERQQRKPLVGAGCVPWPIAPTTFGRGTLLVASDGLLRYAKRGDIARIASGTDLDAAARALIDWVRLSNGELQDDIAVVLCRAV